MIKIKYYATERDDLVSHLSHDDENPISIKPLSEIEDKIKKSTPIFNFASFFGDGIDLYDETIELGSEADYYGFIPQRTEAEQCVVVSFKPEEGKEAPWLDNGITIEFNKHTCRKITVERNGTVLGTAEAEVGESLPEKVHIAFTTPEESWADVNIIFSDFPTDAPINLKGVLLGKVVDVDDIMSFDMITETNPVSDDFALNETNVTAVIEEEFAGVAEHKVLMHDNGELLEKDYAVSVKETDENIFDFKSRNFPKSFDSQMVGYPNTDLFSPEFTGKHDWNKAGINSAYVLDGIATIQNADAFQDLSPFLPECSKRKYLQQVAWAICCGIDTTYSETPRLVPFFATEVTEPDIVISNSDDRILKTSVAYGDKYSKIVWKKIKYIMNEKQTNLDNVILELDNEGRYVGERIFDEPVSATIVEAVGETMSETLFFTQSTPYRVKVWSVRPSEYPVNISGYTFSKQEESVEIVTGIKDGSTLEISDQFLYPIDDSKKIAQLKKWYSHNNTLSATIVDNDSQIRLGKVIKVELKKPGTFFQGIVTKIVRNNVGSYHTVELEAHQWD